MTLISASWPACRLGEAIDHLARQSRLGSRRDQIDPIPSDAAADPDRLGIWIEAAAARMGLEAEEVDSAYAETSDLLVRSGPALFRMPGSRDPHFLAILRGDSRHATLLAPDLSQPAQPLEDIRAALCAEVEGPVAAQATAVLDAAAIRGRRRRLARQAVLREMLCDARVGHCWLLRPAGGAGLLAQAREARLPRLLAILLAAQAAATVLFLLSWWLLGNMTLGGQLEMGWLLAWLLLLITVIPFRVVAAAAEGLVALRAGAVLKRHLLRGALRLGPDDVRHMGVGTLLGRVIESEVVETTALGGGFQAVRAAIELLLAALVLAAGAGGLVHLGLLAGCVILAAVLGLRYFHVRQAWTNQRLGMTGDLVDKLVGHRTRLAQEPRAAWNDGEDQALEQYVGLSARLDALAVKMRVLVPRCWLLLGFVGLVPAFVQGAGTAAMAVAVGGILLASQAFHHLAGGLEDFVAAAIAWQRVQPFWRAAGLPETIGHPVLMAAGRQADKDQAPGKSLVEARALVFRYQDRCGPVLNGFDLRVERGERLLLQGPSGAGKSTLASVLAGNRQPDSGLLLLHGLDRQTLGQRGWGSRVVVVPQFHENHVLMGTLAFNALLGRDWPPQAGDLEEAERILRGLKLGPLLARMPAGLHQTVGETGWQLSHGERSRLFVARALLQGADLIILDESFAALDPQTLEETFAFVLEEARTLLVIAHP
jgi:ATP-binding cassette subfamily B protein